MKDNTEHITKILFICTGNRDRSKTAESIFNGRFPEYRCKSAGINAKMCEANGTTYLNQSLLDEADIYVFMQPFHYLVTAGRFIFPKDKIHHIWNIHNNYRFMEPALVEELIKAFKITFHISNQIK